MAAFTLSSPIHTPYSLRLLSSYSSQNTPTLSFYSHAKPSFTFPFTSLRPRITSKPSYRFTVVSALNKLSESELVAVPPEPDQLSGEFPSASGVYAVYDKNSDLQFIGISRNIAASVLGHRKSVPELCVSVKRVVGILESEGADYESVDVLDEEYNSGLRDALKKYSNWPTFPQVFVNGDLVGGCDILSTMHEKGELSSLLKK